MLTCSAQEYSRTASLTEGINDTQQGGRANRFCARRITDGVVDFWEYSFTLCSAFDIRAQHLMGYVDPIFGDPNDPTRVTGFKDIEHQTAGDPCCTPAGQACQSNEVSALIWSLAWCGDEQHPEFLYNVHIAPRLRFRIDTSSIVTSSTFQTFTVTARSAIPRANPDFDPAAALGAAESLATGFGLGPGDLYPQTALEPVGLDRNYANVLTNTPFPAGCDCGQCV